MGGPDHDEDGARCVMIVAVEPSGDALGAGLAGALRSRLRGRVRFVGVGGPLMAAEGIESAFDPARLAVVGVFNGVAVYPEVLRRARQTAALAAAQKPDVAVLIDAWGFNLRVARALRRVDASLPLVKYVGPQVWATRPGRARTLAGAVDALLTIHSFDSPLFEAAGLPTRFVGNPALTRDISTADGDRFRSRIDAQGDPVLLILPGSRAGEVDRLMPVFRDAVDRLVAVRPNLRLVLPVADSVAARVASHLAEWRHGCVVLEGEAARLDAMAGADVALACSGTVTTELARLGCPMVVAYRLGPLTHAIARVLIRTRYITLFNVAAQAFVAPERVQDDCNGPRLAADLGALLDDPALRRRQSLAQSRALDLMRGGVEDPVAAAAEAVLDLMRSSRSD